MGVILRPEKVGTMWASKNLGFVHGPRFIHPSKLVSNSYIITPGIDVRTKLAILKSNGERVVQSRLRRIKDSEKPLISRIEVQSWMIQPIREFGRRLYAVYSFYFDFKEAMRVAKSLKKKGYRVRITDGNRRGINYWLVFRDDSALYYPKWYPDQRMVI